VRGGRAGGLGGSPDVAPLSGRAAVAHGLQRDVRGRAFVEAKVPPPPRGLKTGPSLEDNTRRGRPSCYTARPLPMPRRRRPSR
jgi:hypothetical protein